MGDGNFENMYVSSRTDRGVHAIKNTFHVDIRPRKRSDSLWDTTQLHTGLNHFLSHQNVSTTSRRETNNQTRIVAVRNAPLTMRNIFFNGTEQNGPEEMDWNARFSATSRTYMYRILQQHSSSLGVPFEWDRAWIMEREKELNVAAMNEAARHLIGTHDVSSFRGTRCKRSSPIVALHDISVTSHPYQISAGLGMLGSSSDSSMDDRQRLILINVTGKSFVYRQVRNIVGCLVEVGRERLMPIDVKKILEARDRKKAPKTAPAAGLFLVDVKHGDFLL